jgi:hypothetical protein
MSRPRRRGAGGAAALSSNAHNRPVLVQRKAMSYHPHALGNARTKQPLNQPRPRPVFDSIRG